MNYKNFFRPTKGKIILGLIILLLMPLYLNTGIVCESYIREDLSKCDYYNYKPLILSFSLISFNLGLFALPFIFNLIFSYAFACLILFLYNTYFYKNISEIKTNKNRK